MEGVDEYYLCRFEECLSFMPNLAWVQEFKALLGVPWVLSSACDKHKLMVDDKPWVPPAGDSDIWE